MLVLLLSMQSTATAQYMVDTINPYRVVERSTRHGVSTFNTLDTYLSGYNHKGAGYHITCESLRRAHTGDYNWIYTTRTNATLGIGAHHSNHQIIFMASRRWSGYHSFVIGERLKILVGANAKAEGGALYTPSYSNNPVSAKINVTMGASAMAQYTFNVGEKRYRARYAVDVPLIVAMFAPEYGQSYYEIFGLGDTKGIVHISTPFNAPSFTQSLSIDVPIKSSTLRLAYIADIYQSDINSLRTHVASHSISYFSLKTNDLQNFNLRQVTI